MSASGTTCGISPLRAYAERFERMWFVCGPGSWPTLFASDAEIRAAGRLVAASGGGAGSAAADPELLAARRLYAAAVHPDTLEPIPLPFRMAAHVPVNALLLVAMLSARSVVATGAAQCANQLFNACQFYANRNATNEVSDARLAASCAGATASAVLVAGGLTAALARAGSRASPTALWALGAAVPFLGAAAGKPLQIGLMRADELLEGVAVYDADGACIGRSAAAGRAAVVETIATRTLYLVPMLWMPYLHAALLARAPALRASPAASLVAYTLHAAFTSAVVTPACIALFEQRASRPVDALEPQLAGHTDAHGAPVTRVWYNKGL